MTDKLVVFTTFGSEEDAARVVAALLEERLIACGTVLPRVRSMYRWQNRVQDQSEALALLKSDTRCWPQLERRLLELHPYQTPECLALPVRAGAAKYLAWMEAELQPPSGA
ncbi:MAG TPA: divalent-cation tolerance protein CutA [Candidatus Saccharimonadales bacterium]|nr:divalent-cation tolerance protein CutA [Candidatus Saccharimonadales bacterium]